jgi:hypothetical protein
MASNRFFDNTTTCDTAASYAYVSYTVGPCITVNDTSFTVDCSTGAYMHELLSSTKAAESNESAFSVTHRHHGVERGC